MAFLYINSFTVLLPHVMTMVLLDKVALRLGHVLADWRTWLRLVTNLSGNLGANFLGLVAADLLSLILAHFTRHVLALLVGHELLHDLGHVLALLPWHIPATIDIHSVTLLLYSGVADGPRFIVTLHSVLVPTIHSTTVMVLLANLLRNTAALLLIDSVAVLLGDIPTLLLGDLGALLLHDGIALLAGHSLVLSPLLSAADLLEVGGARRYILSVADGLGHSVAAVLVLRAAGRGQGRRGE